VGHRPWWKDGYAHGFSTNTLARVRQGGRPVDAERRIELQAPDGLSVATGWKGLATGRQVVTLGSEVDNAAIFFGKPTGARAEGRCEVVQFGGAGDVTADVLAAVRKLVAAYGRTTGTPFDGPVRVFLADTGGGGVRVDHALVVGYSGTDVPALLPTLAHELFHHWVGGMLRVEDGMTWFLEGFTDYLSLWHLVHAGLVEPSWFADRLRQVEALARRSDAWGRVAFADPGIAWRDGDGPLETMAYRGGALLAFALDAELRRDGGRGLPALVGDLLRDPQRTADLARLRARLEERGLEGFYREFVEGRARPDLAQGLRAAGFASSPRAVPLTYAGLATEGDGVFARVRAVDPEGPAAKAGIRVGDRVTGFWPSRDPRPQVSPGFRTEYPYGLDLFAPGEMIYFGVDRSGEALQIDLAPRVVEGGLEPAWAVGDLEAVRAFFALGGP
jgi:hypothetical protein